jgi:hypothetical protein
MPPAPRPTFARSFPRAPELDALVEAFARGDYAHVRAHAPALERSTDDPAVRGAARTLRERTRPDPIGIILLAATAVLFLILAVWSIVHGRAP